MRGDLTADCSLYEGRVEHRRRTPRGHAFAYRLFHVCLELDSFETAHPNGWSWPSRWLPWAQFRRTDHFGPPERPLSETVRDLVEERLGLRPAGPIRLVTHLRSWGYLINPVSFYFCEDDAGHLSAVVAEVQNTPWNERHCYVLEGAAVERGEPVEVLKDFHVSPFFEMEMSYRFRFSRPGERLSVTIENWRGSELLFEARLQSRRREMTRSRLLAALLRYPWMTGRVFAAIYWQAFLLWWKGVTYVPHPGTRRHGPPASLRQTTSI